MSHHDVTSWNGHEHKLDATLRAADAVEARRLLQVWHLLGQEPMDEYPSEAGVARARRTLLAVMERDLEEPADVRAVERPAARRADRTPAAPRIGRNRILVSALVLAAVVIAAWWLTPTTAHAPRGERVIVRLADGSRVHLNSGASLRYGRAIGLVGRRAVRLQGEAFFDVAPAGRPFVVRTFNADVTVLGTRFNVRAWTDLEASTFVAVESGRVHVSPGRAVAERAAEGGPTKAFGGVTLSAGESVRIVRQGADSLTVRIGDAAAWRAGDFVYKDRMLAVIIADIERRFDVAVRLDPAVSETTYVTLALRAPSGAEGVVRDVAGALGLQYRARSDGFELYRP